LLIGAWLVYDTYSKRGPLVTVTWQAAQGLVAGQSRVKHKDVELGQVQTVALSPDLSHVTVTIRMNKMAEPMLTSNAQLWVVTPRFFAGSLSGLGTCCPGPTSS
jgi:paraquat-inducible protein B